MITILQIYTLLNEIALCPLIREQLVKNIFILHNFDWNLILEQC